MKHKVSDIIENIEGNFDVKNIQTKRYGLNFEIYPWLKAKLFHKYIMGVDTLQKKSIGVLWSQVLSLCYGTWNLFIRKYEIWAFTNSIERIKISEKYHDKIFDGIDKQLNRKMLIIEFRLFKKFSYFKVASKYVASKSLFLLFEELYGFLFIRNVKIDHSEIIDQIEKELNCKIQAKSIVRKQLAQYRMMRFWLAILPNPKIVFLTVSYSNYGYITAFKEKGIKVIEFQHGVINKNHQAYYYKAKLNPIQFPDALCVFGSNEYNFLQRDTEFPHVNNFIVGRSIMDHYLHKAIENKEIKRICVSLQDGPVSDELIHFLLEFNSGLTGTFEFVLVPRRTPKKIYIEKYDFPDNFSISEQNVYENIAASDAHLTAYSTTAIEALSMGKRSILIDLQGKAKEVFRDTLGNNPFVFFTVSFNDLENHLINAEITDKVVIAKSNDDNIKSDYSSNISSFLTEICK